jgi:hypothetical protein
MTSRHMSDGASMRALSRRDMTYRAAGAGEPLIHPRLERSHDRRRLLQAQLPRYFKRQRLITARAYFSARRNFLLHMHTVSSMCGSATYAGSRSKGDRSHDFLNANRGNSGLERLAVPHTRETVAYGVSPL